MEFSRQEYWSRLPFATPGDLSHPEIKRLSLASPVLAGMFFTTSATWSFTFRGSDCKESACNVGDLVWSPGPEDSPEKRMTTHYSILAWRIPWTEKPGRLQSMGSQRVGHDWATNTSATREACWDGALNIITNVCVTDRQRSHTPSIGVSVSASVPAPTHPPPPPWEGDVEIELRAIWRCWHWRSKWCGHKPRNAGSHQKWGSLLAPPEGAQHCLHLDVGPVRLISTFWPQELREYKFLLF